MTSPSRLVAASLRSYPSWWRERYGDEMTQVVEDLARDGRSSARLSTDLLVGSARARFAAAGAPSTAGFWQRRTQNALLVATLPWFAVLPLFSVYAATEGQYSQSGGPAVVPFSVSGDWAEALQLASYAIFLITFFVVTEGWRRLRAALAEGRTRSRLSAVAVGAAQLGFLLAVAGAIVGMMGPSRVCRSGSVVANSCTSMTSTATWHAASILAIVGAVLLGAAWAVMPFVVTRSVRKSLFSAASLRSGSRVATLLATLLTTLAALVVACKVALLLQTRPPSGTSYIVMRSSLGVWYTPVAAGLTLLALSSLAGASAARRASRRALELA